MSDVQTSIVGLAPAVTADTNIELLINLYEQPLDPDDVNSAVHSVKTSLTGTQGTAAYNVVEWLTSLDTAAGGMMVACSMDGNIHLREQGTWSVIDSGCDAGLNSIFSLDDSTAYAVAVSGQIVRIGSRQAHIDFPGTGTRLNSIHGCSPSCLYAVGDDGLVARFDGQAWSVLEPFTNANLLAVLCVAHDNVFVAGALGIVFHWDGQVWKRFNAPPVTLTSIACYKNRIYLASGKDGIFIVEDETLEHLKQLILYRLRVIDDLMYGVGGSLLAWFDGAQWRGGAYAVK